MTDKKKFGLVMPQKVNSLKIKKNSIFNDDSDEDEKIHKRPKIPQKKMELKTDSVDPSIYEYDNIYDEMKRKQMNVIAPKENKSSRYIETLLKAAEKRKKEYERRLDRKIQAEREKEGDKYKDKEAFVTSSYKKKMLEQEEEEEKERRENMLNDMMDVTKQKDLSGFYRHFLKQTVGEEKIPQFGDRQIKKEIVSDNNSSDERGFEKERNIDQDSDSAETDDSKSSKSESDSHMENEKVPTDSEIQDVEQISDKNKSESFQIKKRNRKHYRKSTRNSSSSEKEDNDLSCEKISHSTVGKKSDKNSSLKASSSRHDSHSSSDTDNDTENQKDEKSMSGDCSKDKKKNFNIFAKRTVGEIFIQAQARYFQRMASKKV